jgi:negative regulator of flagellin synthesis FlgM
MATKSVGSNPANLMNPLLSPDAKATGKAQGVKDAPIAPAAPAVRKGGESANFGVSISPEAKERAEAQKKAFDIAKSTPDIREDRVADIKARIAAGTYQVDSGQIADGMLREAVKEHLADLEDR